MVIADLVNVHNERRPCRMENDRKRDVGMNGSFDEAKHEWPSPRLFPCRVIQGESRRADVHSGTNCVHVWTVCTSIAWRGSRCRRLVKRLIGVETVGLHSSGSVQDPVSSTDIEPSRGRSSYVSVCYELFRGSEGRDNVGR